jgi:integrase
VEDIRDGKAYFTITKNKKTHFIPLVGKLNYLVGYERGEPEDRVFGLTPSMYRSRFDTLREELNFSEPWSTHDFRRTFSEHMLLIGYSETDIALANNQSSTSVTRNTT